MTNNNKRMTGNRAVRIAIIIFIILSLLAIGLLGYGAYRYNSMMDEIHNKLPGDTNQTNDGGTNQEDTENLNENNLQPITVMIIGVDSRGGEHGRSDTMMLATIDPKNERVLLFSIPRDTYAYVEDVGYTKFNHSMFYGGPSLVKQTMEDFFDTTVDRYVTIDFEGFRRVVDELGGVEIDVDRRMKYYDPADGTNIDLYPGLQMLNGEDALGYARFRLSDTGVASTDFERIERQQEVIRKIIDKGNNVGNIFKIFSFMDIVGDHVKTDLTKEEIHAMVRTFKDFQSENLQTVSISGYGDRRNAEGYELWVYVVPEEERERINELIHYVKEGKNIPDRLLDPEE